MEYISEKKYTFESLSMSNGRQKNGPAEFCIWMLPTPTLLPHILDIFADIDTDIGWFDAATNEFCAGKPMTLTPFPWPGLEVPNASFSTGGYICVLGWVCWCFDAFVRRFVTGTSRFRRGSSTGFALRRVFGNFERACRSNKYRQKNKCENLWMSFIIIGGPLERNVNRKTNRWQSINHLR